jgi:uncharacterized protein (DUF58 family)
MALTRKAVTYLALSYLFIGLALGLRDSAITAFVIPLALVFFCSSMLSPHERSDLKIRRSLYPPRSFGGESINVTVQVQNNSHSEIGELHLEDHIPESLLLEAGTNSLTLSMRPREQVEHSYRISAPERGRHLLGPMKVRSVDLMGFREFSSVVPGLDQVTILPKVEDLGTVELKARRVGPWPGAVPSSNLGAGTEFFELRLYTPGDELRRINWKASAKQGRLVANDFESERVTDVLIVLDCSEAALSKLFDFDAAEFEVTLSASLCSQLILQGNRVGLLAYGAERTWVAPAFGKRQLLRLLTGLAIVKAGRATVPIGYAVETIVAAVLPARSVIVFVSPLMGNEVVDAITNVGSAGYSVICFTPTVGSFEKQESEARLLARRILAAERRVNIGRVAAVARLHEVSPQTSIKLLLRRRIPWRLA